MTSTIPHRLDLVIDYVNTLDHEAGTDALATSNGAIEWLCGNGLLKTPRHTSSPDDLQRAVDLREALRALMLEHNGGPHDPRAIRALEQAARGG